MSIRIASLTAALLMSAPVCGAQTAPFVFTATESRTCVPQENRRAKKQQELVEVQAKRNQLQNAIAAFEEGILAQQHIEGMGQLHAVMGGSAGVARVTKAMSDTFLELTQSASPLIKKTYDAFDALVATGTAVYQGDPMNATASGFDTAQKGNTAYISYRRSQDPLAILPQAAETPGRIASAVRMTDDLSRGDLAGTTSKFAAEVAGMVDKNSKKTRLALGVVSKGGAGIADTPGKTMDSRFADELGAFGDASKLAANLAHTRGAGGLAAMAGRSGRLLGHSGMMLEKVSQAKQGLAEAADMYGEYKKVEKQSAKTQAQVQRQIAKKSEEIAGLDAEARRISNEVARTESEILSCQVADRARQAKANTSSRTRPATRGSSNERLDGTSWRTGSPYGQTTWDRQASRQRRERITDLRRQTEERAIARDTGGATSSQSTGPAESVPYSSPSFTLEPARPGAPPSNVLPSGPDKVCYDRHCPNQ
jgi:hypothetical protein